ncbi:MAG: hypothetical protein ACRD1U_05235 [Vicinamibacterales bacterium]
MSGVEGSLALKLDFGERATLVTSTGGRGRAGLRLAPGPGRPTGPDKYRLLEERRRRAQISARRLLDVMEGEG